MVLAGDIWDAILDPARGHEQGGFRPVVIVSGNWFHRAADEMVWSVPVTRTDKGFHTHVELTGAQGGLSSRSFAMCEQIRAISHERLKRKRGSVESSTLEVIRAVIRELLID
jgi:mRNA interferase MazF